MLLWSWAKVMFLLIIDSEYTAYTWKIKKTTKHIKKLLV